MSKHKHEVAFAYTGDTLVENQDKWEHIKRLQQEIADINFRGTAESRERVAAVQGQINDIWNELAAPKISPKEEQDKQFRDTISNLRQLKADAARFVERVAFMEVTINSLWAKFDGIK